MEGYLYETHLHTLEASACGKVAGADYIDYMIAKGFDGMIVTDHFFSGNTAVDPKLSWKERVQRYMEGYQNAVLAAKGKDFDVLFGVEHNFEGDEYLIYGIDEKWLLENDDILTLSRREVYKRVHLADAIMIQAHPFRERHYLTDIRLTPEVCDGIEVYNAANPDEQNALAYQYAIRLGVPMTAGSDIHYFYDGFLGGMVLPERAPEIKDYVSAVKAKEAIPVRVFESGRTPVSKIKELIFTDVRPGVPVLYK